MEPTTPNRIVMEITWTPKTDSVLVTEEHYEGTRHVGTLRGEIPCRAGEEAVGGVIADTISSWLMRCREIRLGV